jgi:hypothetical protein
MLSFLMGMPVSCFGGLSIGRSLMLVVVRAVPMGAVFGGGVLPMVVGRLVVFVHAVVRLMVVVLVFMRGHNLDSASFISLI